VQVAAREGGEDEERWFLDVRAGRHAANITADDTFVNGI